MSGAALRHLPRPLLFFTGLWAVEERQGMPKLKTHKGLAKRVKVTKKGKIKRRQGWHRHLMTGKGGARRRRTKRAVIMTGAEARRVGRLLGLR